MTKTEMAHIWLDKNGTAWIDDTSVKVTEVVLWHLAYGWSPAEIHFQNSNFSLAQIHAALAYYYDHKSRLDEQIERELLEVEAMMEESKEDPVHKKFRELKALWRKAS